MKKALAFLLLIGACATPYQPAGARGGFSELRLNERAYEVSFKGNGYTKPERAQQYALRRAADLTLKSGFTHFVLDGQDSQQSISSMPTDNGPQLVNRPLTTVRFRMLTPAEASSAPLGVAYDAALMLHQLERQ